MICFYCTVFCINIRKRSHRLPRDDNLIKIVDFLKDLKAEKIAFSDYCIICLNEYVPNKSNSLGQTDENVNSLQVPFEAPKEVVTLSCGHQYHYECITLWMKTIIDCPFCYYKYNHRNENNAYEDNGKIVWESQIVLHPSFKGIKYENLYTWKFQTYSSSSDYGGDFGGCDGGGGGGGGAGGATGSW